jgi:putative flippase GtrA
MNRTDIRLQFACYLVVGGSAFLVELVTFLLLLSGGVAPIPASVASFVVASAANYALSNLLAFARGDVSRGQEMLRFAVVALVGLGLNTAVVWILLALGAPAVFAKVSAVAPVLMWNFLGRRLFVFSDRIPEPAWRVGSRIARGARPIDDTGTP